jgi:hypothetical protein
MTKASFTATGMASPCKDFWALVDLIAHPPFLKSPKPKAASQFDRSQMARVQRGLVSMVRVSVFQPLIALPSLLPSFHCLQLLPAAAGACCCKKKMCAGLYAVCSIRGRAAVQALAEKKPPSSPSTGHAMVPAYSYRHGSLHGHSRRRRAPEPFAGEQRLCSAAH